MKLRAKKLAEYRKYIINLFGYSPEKGKFALKNVSKIMSGK